MEVRSGEKMKEMKDPDDREYEMNGELYKVDKYTRMQLR